MKGVIAEFKYDKQDGTKPKNRKIFVLSRPSDSYLGIEFDKLDELEGLFDYLAEKDELEERLKLKYGIKDLKYKRFKEQKISQLNEEKIDI